MLGSADSARRRRPGAVGEPALRTLPPRCGRPSPWRLAEVEHRTGGAGQPRDGAPHSVRTRPWGPVIFARRRGMNSPTNGSSWALSFRHPRRSTTSTATSSSSTGSPPSPRRHGSPPSASRVVSLAGVPREPSFPRPSETQPSVSLLALPSETPARSPSSSAIIKAVRFYDISSTATAQSCVYATLTITNAPQRGHRLLASLVVISPRGRAQIGAGHRSVHRGSATSLSVDCPRQPPR
jgi:hypothetical protein